MAGDATAPPPTPPTPPAGGRWWVDALWLLALAAWGAAWCLSAAPELGVTFDEPFYLDAGMDSWRGWSRTDGYTPYFQHETGATNGVMPLPIDSVTSPLAVHEWRTGEKLDSEQKIARLRWARATTLGWFALLIVSAWRLGRATAGPWGGRIASGLIAADPNFLAHASLATTDIAVTAALTAFARAVYAGRSGGWWRRVTLPGLWYGVAVLCKLSALLYGGIILVTLEVCYRLSTGALYPTPGRGFGGWVRKVVFAVFRSVLAAAAVILIGAAIAVAYCGYPYEGEKPFTKVANAVPPDEPLKEVYLRWAEDAGRVPHAVNAFAFQWWYNAKGRASYLKGTFYPEGYRYFFPELLLMKIPLPVFALALAALPRVRAVLNPFTLVALLLLAVLLEANLQIGVRLAFPVMALGYIAVATAVARGYPRCAPWLGVPTILALAGTSVWVWPNGLGYINQAHGGMEAAPRLVTDSNVDWGHGIPDLRRWHEANGSPPMRVWYFGTDPAVAWGKQPFERIEPYTIPDGPEGRPRPITGEAEFRKIVPRCVLAVGHTVVTLHPTLPPGKGVALDYLRTRRPMARTATFTLYDFRDENGPPPLE